MKLLPVLGTAYHTRAEGLFSCYLGILGWKHHFPDLFCIALTLVCVCVCVCARAHALSISVYLTLCNPMDYSPPYSSVHGILQARILECIAVSFSRGSFQPRDWTLVSCVSYIGSRMPGNPKPSLGTKGCFRVGKTSEISVILFLWHCSTNLERSGETLGVYSMKFTTYKYKFGIRKRD